MSALLIRHKVEDFAAWKAAFDQQAAARRANGCQGGRLFRNAADPKEVVILLAWDILERASLFADSDDLRQAITRAGVADRPDIWILEETDRLAV